MTPKAFLKLIGISVVIALPVSLAAIAFSHGTHDLQKILWEHVPDKLGYESAPWWLVVGLILFGTACVALALKWHGKGGAEPLHHEAAHTFTVSDLPSVIVAAVGSLAFGAVLGPELPLLAIGGAIALYIAKATQADVQTQKLMVGAGQFTAFSAMLANPFLAAIFLIESMVAKGLGAAVTAVVTVGLLSSGVGYVLYSGFANWTGLSGLALALPDLPAYKTLQPIDIALGMGVALVAAVVCAASLTLSRKIYHSKTLKALGATKTLFIGALVLIALGLFAQVLTPNGVNLVLFSGQLAIAPIVYGGLGVGVLMTIVFMKSIGYAVSASTGFRGGLIFPSIFLGITIAVISSTAFDASLTPLLAAGISAAVAASLRQPLSAVAFGVLLVGTSNASVLPIASFAMIIGLIVGTVFEKKATPTQTQESLE